MNTQSKSLALQEKRKHLIWFTLFSTSFLALTFLRVHKHAPQFYQQSNNSIFSSFNFIISGSDVDHGVADNDFVASKFPSMVSFKIGAEISQRDLNQEKLYFQTRSSRRRSRSHQRMVISEPVVVAAEAVMIPEDTEAKEDSSL